MMSIQAVEHLLIEAERLPMEERLILIERLAEGIRQARQLPAEETENDIENACGILQAPRTVSLEQMETAIRKRGGHL